MSQIVLIGVPAHVFYRIFGSRLSAHSAHPVPLSGLEMTWLAASLLVTFACSLTAAAGLQASMDDTRSLWKVIGVELWLLMQLAIVGLFARVALMGSGGLSLQQAVLAPAYLLVWSFLVGYVAKIPWDRARLIITSRLKATYKWIDDSRAPPPSGSPDPVVNGS